MSCDRFVYWTEDRPTPDQLFAITRDFFGDTATVTRKANGTIYAKMGARSEPLAAVSEYVAKGVELEKAFPVRPQTRCIELFPHDNSVDVITRLADEFTDALADGLARLLARYYRARLDDPAGILTPPRPPAAEQREQLVRVIAAPDGLTMTTVCGPEEVFVAIGTIRRGEVVETCMGAAGVRAWTGSGVPYGVAVTDAYDGQRVSVVRMAGVAEPDGADSPAVVEAT